MIKQPANYRTILQLDYYAGTHVNEAMKEAYDIFNTEKPDVVFFDFNGDRFTLKKKDHWHNSDDPDLIK